MSRLTTAANVRLGEEEEESISCAVLNARVAPGGREMGVLDAAPREGVIAGGVCLQAGCNESSIRKGRGMIVFTLALSSTYHDQ
jgi:hypothetical protein